ncbi:MAG: MOSC domain-containing protein [Bacteroidota bacterium]
MKSKLRTIIDTLPQTGTLVSIAIRPIKREPLVYQAEVQLNPEEGIIGDHYSGTSGKRQVTLIQEEHLKGVAQMLDTPEIDPLLTRRNLVVSGINLLAFKGRQFYIGETLLEMTGPCEPCSRMEDNFGPGGYNAMRGHGGICARVLEGGTIRTGDQVRLAPVTESTPA